MTYELILFDADRTLFDYDMAEEFALEKAFIHHEFEFDKENHINIYREINNRIWLEFEEKKVTLEKLKIDRFERLSEALNLKYEAEKFSEIYLSYLSQASFLIDDAEEIVSFLSDKYKIAIITNGIKSVQIPRLSNSPLSKYIKDIFISDDIGFPKPNREIFDYTLEKLAHKNKSKTLIVGDSLSSDIKGGYLYGIDTCWFNPYKMENKSGIKPTYEISSLNQLKDIL